MKIVFVGGGTLGPVTPLLAVAKALRRHAAAEHFTFAWIGTPNGPERVLVEQAGIEFFSLPVVKWPRYPSMQWLRFPFAWAAVRRQADQLVERLKPAAIVTVGGFTAVPVVYAAAKRSVPCLTHQVDLVPGLANRRIARFCESVTTSFQYERGPFGDQVTDERIATPTRFSFHQAPSRERAVEVFGLRSGRPVVLVFGGGTGALALNQAIEQRIQDWTALTQVIHVTGLGKDGAFGKQAQYHGYVRKAFLDQAMLTAYAAADVVICRGGMGGLSEIAALKKPAVIVPIPQSHQEANAQAFEEQGAALVVHQDTRGFEDELLDTVRTLLADEKARHEMGERAHEFFPTDDGDEFAQRVLTVLEKKKTPHRK